MFKKYSWHLSFWEGTSKIVHKHIRLITLGTSLVGLAALYALYKATKTSTGQTPVNRVVKEGDLAPTAGTIEKYVSVMAQLLRNVRGPSEICLDVYITCRTTGPIRKDREFKFGERIKDVKGNPLVIDPVKDFYVQLGFQPTSSRWFSQDFIAKDAKGFSTELYLPSNLFEGKREGDIVSFYYDDQLMELRLCQKLIFTGSEGGFEGFLAGVSASNLFSHKQALFDADIDSSLFCNYEVGDTFTKCTLADSTTVVDLENIEEYRRDQQSAPYRELPARVEEVKNKIVYTFEDLRFERIVPEALACMLQGVKPSDVHVIRSQGVNELDDLWILIPHQLMKNQWGSTMQLASGSNGERFVRMGYDSAGQEFHPEKGDRFSFYQFGQYKRIPIPKGYEFSLKKIQPYRHCEGMIDMQEREVLQVVFSKIAL